MTKNAIALLHLVGGFALAVGAHIAARAVAIGGRRGALVRLRLGADLGGGQRGGGEEAEHLGGLAHGVQVGRGVPEVYHDVPG